MADDPEIRIHAEARQALSVFRDLNQALGLISRNLQRVAENTDPANRELRQMEQQASRAGRAFDRLHGAGLVLGAGFLGVAGALGAVAKAGLDMNVTVQRSEMALTKMTGSATAASRFIAEVRKEAKTSTSTFREMLPVAQSLAAAYGPAGLGKVLPTMRAFGDAAAALGADSAHLQNALMGFQQLLTIGPDMENIRQIQENLPGVQAIRWIRESFGTVDSKALKEAGIGGERIAQVIVAGMQRGFGGSQQQIARTIPGLLSNFQDELNDVLGTLTEDLGPRVERFLSRLVQRVQDLGKDRSAVDALKNAFDGMAKAVERVADAGGAVLDWFKNLKPEQQTKLIENLTLALGGMGLAGALSLVLGSLRNIKTTLEGIGSAKAFSWLLSLGKGLPKPAVAAGGVAALYGAYALYDLFTTDQKRGPRRGPGALPPAQVRIPSGPDGDLFRRLQRAEQQRLLTVVPRPRTEKPMSLTPVWQGEDAALEAARQKLYGPGPLIPGKTQVAAPTSRVAGVSDVDLDALEKAKKAAEERAKQLEQLPWEIRQVKIEGMPNRTPEDRYAIGLAQAALERDRSLASARKDYDQLKGDPRLKSFEQGVQNRYQEQVRRALEELEAARKTLREQMIQEVEDLAADVKQAVNAFLETIGGSPEQVMARTGAQIDERARAMEQEAERDRQYQEGLEEIARQKLEDERAAYELRRDQLALAIDQETVEEKRESLLRQMLILDRERLKLEPDASRQLNIRRGMMAVEQALGAGREPTFWTPQSPEEQLAAMGEESPAAQQARQESLRAQAEENARQARQRAADLEDLREATRRRWAMPWQQERLALRDQVAVTMYGPGTRWDTLSIEEQKKVGEEMRNLRMPLEDLAMQTDVAVGAFQGLVDAFRTGQNTITQALSSILQIASMFAGGKTRGLLGNLGGIVGAIGGLFGFDDAPSDSLARRWGWDAGKAFSQGLADARRAFVAPRVTAGMAGGGGVSITLHQNIGTVSRQVDLESGNRHLIDLLRQDLLTAPTR